MYKLKKDRSLVSWPPTAVGENESGNFLGLPQNLWVASRFSCSCMTDEAGGLSVTK